MELAGKYSLVVISVCMRVGQFVPTTLVLKRLYFSFSVFFGGGGRGGGVTMIIM